MIDILLRELFELPLGNFLIRHKDVIADFHVAAAVAVRVTVFAERRVMLYKVKFVEKLAVWATRVTHGGVRLTAVSTPPVFAPIVEKDALAIFHATGCCTLFTTHIRHAVTEPLRGE